MIDYVGFRVGTVSAKKELHQGRYKDIVSRAMVLTFQDTMLRAREDIG